MNELLLLDIALAIIAAVAIFYARPVIANALGLSAQRLAPGSSGWGAAR